VERDKALEMALGQIEKQFGKGSVMKMGEKGSMAIESIPTGALALDLALGIGGLPRGRVTEIYGPESSGKSTLAMHVVAEAQRNGGICAYIDAEHAMDPVYARPSGSTSTSCSSPSPTPASRRSRSPTCSSAPARSTWS
jgi:recombination protein RecA